MGSVERERDALRAECAALREMLQGAWVRVPMRWRKIPQGSITVDKRGRTWEVISRERDAFRLKIEIRQIGKRTVFERKPSLDDVADVLTPVPMRDGLVLIRGLLGGNMLEPEDAPDAG